MLGRAPEKGMASASSSSSAGGTVAGSLAGAAVAPLGTSVCAAGYPSVGKKSLMRAIRREAKAPGLKWLLEAPARLPVPAGPHEAARAAHLALRGEKPGEGAGAGAPNLVQAAEELLARAPAAAVMRRFRLPAFENAEGFFSAYAEDREVLSKTGKAPGKETIARRVLAEVSQTPGAYCSPQQANAQEGQPDLW